MGFLDDIQNFAKENIEGAKKSIFEFSEDLDKSLDSVTAIVARPKKGNQTAQQIARGDFGRPESVAGPAGNRTRRDKSPGDPLKQAGFFERFPMAGPIGIGLGIFVVGLLVLKRR